MGRGQRSYWRVLARGRCKGVLDIGRRNGITGTRTFNDNLVLRWTLETDVLVDHFCDLIPISAQLLNALRMLHSHFKVVNVNIHLVLQGFEFSLLRCLREARVLDKCLRLCWGLLVKLSVLLLLWWLGIKALVACWSLG